MKKVQVNKWNKDKRKEEEVNEWDLIRNSRCVDSGVWLVYLSTRGIEAAHFLSRRPFSLAFVFTFSHCCFFLFFFFSFL
jgi:hypothetical protein